MTQNEINIIRDFERELQEKYNESKREAGVSSPITGNYLAQWSAIKQLMNSLKIEG